MSATVFCPSGLRFITFLLLIASISPRTNASQPHRLPDQVGGYSSEQVMVRLTRPAHARLEEHRRRLMLDRTADLREGLGSGLRRAAAQWSVSRWEPLYPEEFADPQLAAALGLDRTYLVRVPVGTDTVRLVQHLNLLVDDVELSALDAVGEVAQVIPNDTNFALQYALNNTGQTGGTADADIDAAEAWSLHTGETGPVTVAVIDSGVSPHPEFSSRMLPGRNTADPFQPNLTTDNCPHGTHVAGIISARGNNAAGIAGVTWGAQLLPIRVTQTANPCGGVVSALSAAIIWAADNGAEIANMSLQYYNLGAAEVQTLQSAIDYAGARGVLLIAANGNNNAGGAGVVAYPARLPGCMAVSATTDDDLFANTTTSACRCWRSNFGPETDIAAPGDAIFSTWVNNSYAGLSGTSMATACTTGVAALLKSYRPSLSASHIENLLTATVDDLGPSGWDPEYGHGRVNAHRALLAAVGCSASEDCDDGFWCNGSEVCENENCGPGVPVDCDDQISCTQDACDNATSSCRNDPADDRCEDDDPCTQNVCDAGVGCLFPSNGLCGACCDMAPGTGGLCTDAVMAGDCQGGNLIWTQDQSCDAVSCDEITGACCDLISGACADDVLISGCKGANQSWHERQSCQEALCTLVTGACCDRGSDPVVATCSQTTFPECLCPNCTWTKGTDCGTIVCDPKFDVIPTVSHWGLTVLTLLLLVGGKLNARRLPALPS